MSPTSAASVLVVDDDELIRDLVSTGLAPDGYDLVLAQDGADALARIAEAAPDLIVSDIEMPDMDGLTLIEELRSHDSTRAIPLIFLTARGSSEDIVRGLGLGADDYLSKPFDLGELRARVRSKLERPPVPADLVPRDPRTGLLSAQAFLEEAGRELGRVGRGGAGCIVASLELVEGPQLRERLGRRAVAELEKQVGEIIVGAALPLDLTGRDAHGRFMLLLPETGEADAAGRLNALADAVARTTFSAAGERVRVTPAVGFAVSETGLEAAPAWERARVAGAHSAAQLDLRAVSYQPSMAVTRPRRRLALPAAGGVRLAFQVLLTQLLGLVAPFFAYVALDRAGWDVAPVMYLVVVVALLITSITIWLEGFSALRATKPPAEPGAPHPTASAVIAAYMPNEAATILETVEAFLRLDYPGRLQIVLAYNTPRDLPVEAELRAIAERDPRFVPYRVEGSTSKAQNVNAALSIVSGEFVGVFDADHQPAADAFSRAWLWLSNGYDVVQGHCQIRNGDASWVSRMIAVEFEAIYAVSHPGRARLHDFGIFGGSNGYWRTDVLRQTRMRGSMLTEDIDSSLRALEEGSRIASDPGLISRELAPTTITALWNQRMRWAQGWFQVSLLHLGRALRSPRLSTRNKIGLLYLLPWRELYPWLSLQMFPIIAYYVWKAGSVSTLDWMVPIFVLTTLFTLGTGPGQAIFSYRLAAPEIHARKRWFLLYLVTASLFYTELKNVVARVAQIKEASGERAWKVTPRSPG